MPTWQTQPDDIWHRIARREGRHVMYLNNTSVGVQTSDEAFAFDGFIEIDGKVEFLRMQFPDRTPRDKLRAIADAINAALAAAREVEGLNRD